MLSYYNNFLVNFASYIPSDCDGTKMFTTTAKPLEINDDG